ERPGQVIAERADVSAFAARDFKLGMVRIGPRDEADFVDGDGAGLKLHFLACPGQRIGPLARNLDGGEGGRHLHDLAPEAGERSIDLLIARAVGAFRRDFALGIARGGGLAKPDGKAVALAGIHDERDGLGRLAKGDRQDAGCKRVERARMARLLRIEKAAHFVHHIGGGGAGRLGHDDPAMNRIALLAPGHEAQSSSPRSSSASSRVARSRATSGLCSSRSMASALSKEVSGSKERSGMNLKVTSFESCPRSQARTRPSACASAAASPWPSGATKQVAWRRSGLMRTSVTVKLRSASSGSRIVPRATISARARRTSSPARSWRWLGALPPRWVLLDRLCMGLFRLPLKPAPTPLSLSGDPEGEALFDWRSVRL